MIRSLRRGSLLAVSALTVTALVAPLGGAAHADPDPAPAQDGATWIADEMPDGLMVGAFGPDYGLSIDAALGLDATGGQDLKVEQISDEVEAVIDSYISYEFTDNGTVFTGEIAGATAKSLLLAQSTDAVPEAFGTVDLVERLESLTTDAGPTRGRIADDARIDGEPDPSGDFANVLGQGFAARGLAVAGSPEADPALNFLLKQQCGSGYFRLLFTADKDAPRQRCVDGAEGSEPDTDATALAMINLQALQSSDPDVIDALADAQAWLLSVQRSDGSFGGGTSTEGPNTNSTGLAAWALSQAGSVEAAEDAARWVRSKQIREVGTCAVLADEDGAIAYDSANLAAGLDEGITVNARDQWRRASTQAVVGLESTPEQTSSLTADATTDFVRAGSTQPISLSGGMPGSVCATRAASTVAGSLNVNGNGTVRVSIPGGTRERTFVVADTGGGSAEITFEALGVKRIPFTLDPRVARGGRQVVAVSGLAPHESVQVFLRGVRVDRGAANGNGRFTARFSVGQKLGKATVKVTGEFADTRKNTDTFTVTR